MNADARQAPADLERAATSRPTSPDEADLRQQHGDPQANTDLYVIGVDGSNL
jgi:hypothetical protein